MIVRNLCILICLLVSLHCNLALADISFDLGDTKLTSCEEYSNKVLGNDWDMGQQSDINNFFETVDIGSFNNPAISNGLFSGTTNAQSAYFYLTSPSPCGAYSVGGRWGPDYPIDVSKYTKMYIKMKTNKVDPYGIRLIWDRSCNYASLRTITDPYAIPTKVGWHTYEIPLTSVAIDGGASTDLRPWSAGSITGLAVLPTLMTSADVQIDWIRLEDPSTCNAANAATNYNATANGNDNLISIYLDNDSDPFNGFERQLLTAQNAPSSGSVSINGTNGLLPRTYKVVGVLDSDYASLERTDPWDMNDEGDFYAMGGVSAATYTNGVLSGTAGVGGAQLYLKLTNSGINSAKYRYMSIKGTFSGAFNMLYGTSGSANSSKGSASCALNSGVYNCDMTTSTAGPFNWGSDTAQVLILSIPAGAFSIDFVSLRKSGYDTVRDSTQQSARVFSSLGTLTVNASPIASIVEPSLNGGEAIRTWDMDQNDIVYLDHVTYGSDPLHSNEPYTGYLPDSRFVDGLRGNFFKGTSLQGNDDPTNYSTLLNNGLGGASSFDADTYRNLCFKLNIERAFSLGTGSVGRIIWQAVGGGFLTSDDLPLIYNNWSGSRWYEYCMDMKDVITEQTGTPNWTGNIQAFRVDAHEFNVQTSYYFDYIKLRKDDESPATYNVVFNLNDPDDNSSIDFYYTSDRSSVGTYFATASEADNTRVVQWDTTGVPTGLYYIRAVATDGLSSTTTYSKGRIRVTNTGAVDTAPTLSVQSPLDNDTICDAMQVKGYSFQPDRLEEVQTVEVLVDGILFGSFKPTLYTPSSKMAASNIENSNAGFDLSYSTTSLGAGAHTVTVTSYSSRGLSSTVTRNITKAGVGCTSPVVDPNPAGVPVGIEPTPTVFTNNLIISSGAHRRNGLFTISVNGIASDNIGCTLQFKAGVVPNPTSVVKRIRISQAAQMRFKLAKMLVRKGKKLTKLYMSANLICNGSALNSNNVRLIKLQQMSSGLTTKSQILSALRRIVKY